VADLWPGPYIYPDILAWPELAKQPNAIQQKPNSNRLFIEQHRFAHYRIANLFNPTLPLAQQIITVSFHMQSTLHTSAILPQYAHQLQNNSVTACFIIMHLLAQFTHAKSKHNCAFPQ